MQWPVTATKPVSSEYVKPRALYMDAGEQEAVRTSCAKPSIGPFLDLEKHFQWEW